jgi:hypothetical protein
MPLFTQRLRSRRKKHSSIRKKKYSKKAKVKRATVKHSTVKHAHANNKTVIEVIPIAEVKQKVNEHKPVAEVNEIPKTNNKNKNKISIKKMNCNPTKNPNDFTCYDEQSLERIKNMWNKRNPDNAIKANKKEDIWKALTLKMKNVCDNEMCWLKQEFIDDGILSKELIENAFAPTSPKSWKKNPNEWLSNFDLKKVMKQYENKYDDFVFIGPSPIDFDQIEYGTKCVWNDLCHFKLKTFIDKGKNKIGIIFNTDPHTEGGSHWISTYINIPEGYIYFFNSTGEPVPHEIKVLIDRIIAESKELVSKNVLKKELVFNQNYPMEHQRGGTECGMYSLYFIINVLSGKLEPHFFNREKVTDKEVEAFRKIFFNPSD